MPRKNKKSRKNQKKSFENNSWNSEETMQQNKINNNKNNKFSDNKEKEVKMTSQNNSDKNNVYSQSPQKSNKNKRKNRKKGEKNNKNRQQLLDMKEIRLDDLKEYSDELLDTLDEKYIDYFDNNRQNEFIDGLDEILSFYDNNLTLANNENIFLEQKQKIKLLWDQILKSIKFSWKKDNKELLKEKEKKRRLKEREKNMKLLGINSKSKSSNNRNKNNYRKLSQKQKLKLLQKELEKENSLIKDFKEENNEKIEEKEEKKEENEDITKDSYDSDDNWTDSDSEEEKRDYTKNNPSPYFSDSSEDEIPVRSHYPKNNSNNKIKSPKSTIKVPVSKHTKTKPKKDKSKALKSPICAVIGHVDAGKTSLLDNIRSTSVQDNEPGRITQEIGGTYVSSNFIKQRIQNNNVKISIPGLLFMDTPGHELFNSLRSRGVSYCDIGILVINLMNGLENQTLESLKLLKESNTPFIVVINKIDKCLDWKSENNLSFLKSFNNQKKYTKKDFNNRLDSIKLQLQSNGYNSELHYKNDNPKKYLSLVPISAKTGEGINDLLTLIINLTQDYLKKKLTLKKNKFVCNILEIKKTKGYGVTLDVILCNGNIKKGDKIICCGKNGSPIQTEVKALLLPNEAQEIRVKNSKYKVVKSINGSSCFKISAKGLENAVPGSKLVKISKKLKFKDIQTLKNDIQNEFNEIFNNITKTKKGVFIQSNTLGSIEGIIRFLKELNVPICGINISNSLKKEDIIRISKNESDYACMLLHNVDISKDLRNMALDMNIKLFESQIIYDIQTQFSNYINSIKSNNMIFPVELEILKDCIFRSKSPIIIGCKVKTGIVALNTPICAMIYDSNNSTPNPLYIGKIVSIEKDNKSVKTGKTGDLVSIKIDGVGNIQIGKDFTVKHRLVSKITRKSLDCLKQYFMKEFKDDKEIISLLFELKSYFGIL